MRRGAARLPVATWLIRGIRAAKPCHLVMRFTWRIAWILFGLGVASASAGRAAARGVRVRVTDSAAVPIASAELSIVRGVKTMCARDWRGRWRWRAHVCPTTGRWLLRTRGAPDRLPPCESVLFRPSAQIPCRSSFRWPDFSQQLATVKVTAEEDLKRKRLFIDADGIANSPRLIQDGVDILKKTAPRYDLRIRWWRILPSHT